MFRSAVAGKSTRTRVPQIAEHRAASPGLARRFRCLPRLADPPGDPWDPGRAGDPGFAGAVAGFSSGGPASPSSGASSLDDVPAPGDAVQHP